MHKLKGVARSNLNHACMCKRTPVTPPQASFDFTTPFAGSGGATPLALASPEHIAVLNVKEEALPRDPADARKGSPVAIILEPARELAEQVSGCLTDFKVRVYSFFIGVCVDSTLGYDRLLFDRTYTSICVTFFFETFVLFLRRNRQDSRSEASAKQ